MLISAIVEIKNNTFLAFVTCLLAFHEAAALDIINKDYAGSSFVVADDTFVTDTGSMDFYDIYIENSIDLINAGKINGDISVCDGCEVRVQNRGDINSTFNLGDNSKLTQVIHDDADITRLNVNGSYNLLVNNKNGLSLDKIMSVGRFADKIIFDDSVLVLGVPTVKLARNFVFNPEIELVGNIDVYVDSVKNISDRPILSNVSGQGVVNIYADDMDILYSIKSYIKDGSLYGTLIRETDYSKIFKNKEGEFLDYIRDTNPNDKLLTLLDSAKDINEFNRIKDKSVKLNPKNLMNPIKNINSFYMFNTFIDDTDLSIKSFSLFSDSQETYGTEVAFVNKTSESIKLSMSMYGAYTAFLDDVNDFNSLTFGLSGIVNYVADNLFVNLALGGNTSSFDSGLVFYEEEIVNNPDGYSFYAIADFGKEIYSKNSIFVKPFVSFGTNVISIMNDTAFSGVAGGGADIKFSYDEYDINYDYGVRTKAYVSGQFVTGVYMNFVSVADGAGGNIAVNAVYDEQGFAYNFKLGVDIDF